MAMRWITGCRGGRGGANGADESPRCCVIAENRRQKRIQQVVSLFIEMCIVDAEHFVELRTPAVDPRQIEVAHHHGE